VIVKRFATEDGFNPMGNLKRWLEQEEDTYDRRWTVVAVTPHELVPGTYPILPLTVLSINVLLDLH